MAASVENEAYQSNRAREDARTDLEVLARTVRMFVVRRHHPGRGIERESACYEAGYRDAKAGLFRPPSGLDLLDTGTMHALVDADIREVADAGTTSSDYADQMVGNGDEALAEHLSSEAMDRLATVAKDMSDLAAKTAIDLALIEAKRVQIDRAQAENWALLREVTGKTQ